VRAFCEDDKCVGAVSIEGRDGAMEGDGLAVAGGWEDLLDVLGLVSGGCLGNMP
jgi:hypothetical protein